MTRPEEAARQALRERQGAGARYDAANAPARELDWARRGTAYFARALNNLTDSDLDGPSRLAGLSRRQVIAHVGYQARMLSQAIAWVRARNAGPLPRRAEVASADVDLGATLPARALRHLFEHSEVHLNVEWRDLTNTEWDSDVRDAAGRQVSLRETPVIRARAVWLHAIDLENGGRFADIPPDFVDQLIHDGAAGLREAASFLLVPTDRTDRIRIGAENGPEVQGHAADMARWLWGRGTRGVTIGGRGALDLPVSAGRI